MDTYLKQAQDFLDATNTTLEVVFLRNGKHFSDDDTVRDIYQFTLKRGSRSYVAEFGQSIMNSQYYQDGLHKDRTYTLSGRSRTGGWSLNDLGKYKAGGVGLILKPGVPPTAYDILACLTKSHPGTFEDFCSEYGYDEDSRKAFKSYESVLDEWIGVASIWNEEEMELLWEIQ